MFHVRVLALCLLLLISFQVSAYEVKVKRSTDLLSIPGFSTVSKQESTFLQKLGLPIPKIVETLSSGKKVQYLGVSELINNNSTGDSELFHKVSTDGKPGWMPSSRLSSIPSDKINYVHKKEIQRVEGGIWNYKESICDPPDFNLTESHYCSQYRELNRDYIVHTLNMECNRLQLMNFQRCEPDRSHRKSSNYFFHAVNSTTFIPIQCINISQLKGEKQRLQNRTHCSASGNHVGKTNPNCVKPYLTRYLHWQVNEALNCLNSGGDPMDPMEVFKIINHESGFQVNVEYDGGVGIMQLTTPGARNMEKNRPSARVWNSVKDNKACESFKDVMEKPIEMSSISDKSCDFISIDDGLRRSLIYGLSLHKFNIRESTRLLSQMDFPTPADRQKSINVVARAAYHRGFQTAKLAFDEHIDVKKKYPSYKEFEADLELAMAKKTKVKKYEYSSKINRDYKLANFKAAFDPLLIKVEELLAEQGINLLSPIDAQGNNNLKKRTLNGFITQVERIKDGRDSREQFNNFYLNSVFETETPIDRKKMDEVIQIINKYNKIKEEYFSTPADQLKEKFPDIVSC